MLPKVFKPRFSYNLLRIGSRHDGGYLVEKNSLLTAKSLLSFGISDNWEFEKHFLNTNRIPLKAFDHTIDLLVLFRNVITAFVKIFLNIRAPLSSIKSFSRRVYALWDYKIFFRNQRTLRHIMVGYSGKNAMSLDEILSVEKLHFPVFLKCDIEGWEYRILDQIVAHSDKLSGLIVEFHDIDLHSDRIKKFIENFPLTLVHTHANNFGGYDNGNDPLVVEMTFSSAPCKTGETASIPHPEDTPNNPHESDLPLTFG